MENKFHDIPLRVEIQPYMFELPVRVDCNAQSQDKIYQKNYQITVILKVTSSLLIIVPSYTQVHTTCIFSKYDSWIYIILFDNFIKLSITKLEYM